MTTYHAYLERFKAAQLAQQNVITDVLNPGKPQSIPFPSGSVLKTDGDKIVGRIDFASRPSDEKVREPLPHFNQRTPFDSFGSDWVVYSDAITSGFTPKVVHTPGPTTQGAYPAVAGLLRVKG